MLTRSTRAGLLLLTLLLASLPVLFGGYVNETAPNRPTTRYVASRCTRYCEAHSCPHATAANSPAYWRLKPLYHATIAALGAGGASCYAAANIAVFLVAVPLLLLMLTYGLLRDAVLIRRLKQQPHD
ncbi:hypothetical protein GCM10022409_13750 [Hymenobacter glaciei]|uniref:Uncharacterized protein n=1 Tax=Hymenobacter glaciei TaxID=877209 RepID=A0ABP7TSY8_9BACT